MEENTDLARANDNSFPKSPRETRVPQWFSELDERSHQQMLELVFNKDIILSEEEIEEIRRGGISFEQVIQEVQR